MPDLPAGTVTFLFTDLEGSTAPAGGPPGRLPGRRAPPPRPAPGGRGGPRGGGVRDGGGRGVRRLRPPHRRRGRRPGGAAWPCRRRTGASGAGALGPGWGCTRARRSARGRTTSGRRSTAAPGSWPRPTGGRWCSPRPRRTWCGTPCPPGAGLRDLGAHRLKDLQAPGAGLQLLHPELPAEFPALRTLDALPHNLPLQLTSFVGPGAGAGGGGRLPGGPPPGDPDRRGGHRQDAPGPAGGRRGAPRVPGRRLAGGAGRAARPGAGAPGRGRPRRRAGGAGPAPAGHAHRRAAAQAPAAGAGQLRAPAGRLRPAGGRPAAGLPAPDVLATSREALGIAGETVWRVPSLAVPAGARRPAPAAGGDADPVRGGRAVRRPRAGGAAPLRGDARERPGGGGALRPAGRHPPGPRAGGRPRAGALRRPAPGPAGGPLPAADGGQPHGAGAPPDAAGGGGLEPRPAHRARAGAVPAPGGVRRGLEPGGGRGGGPGPRRGPTGASRGRTCWTC